MEIPYFDLNVNSVCSLQCKNCDQGIPYYHNRKIFTAEKILSNLNKLFKYVDFVYSIGIIGGEPFLNQDLDIIISYCLNSTKIGKIVLVTNGTIFPDNKVLNLLSNQKKITLVINQYPLKNFSTRTKLINHCRENHILVHSESNDNWLDFGDYSQKRNYSIAEKKIAFKNCFLKDCVQYHGGYGYLFRCTRSVFLLDQKIEKPDKKEYVNIHRIKSKKEMKQALKEFYKLKYIKACDYCNYGQDLKVIPIGEQIEK